MIKRYLIVIIVSLFMPLLACNTTSTAGGTEAGNPPTMKRALQGEVPSNTSSSVMAALQLNLTTNCVADTVIATPQTGTETTAEIASDCSFSILLDIETPYEISFERTGTLVGELSFLHNTDIFPTSFLVLDEGTVAIDIGLVTFNDLTASPESEPATQVDQDGDGIVDLNDPDDNGDSVVDVVATDSDFDGIFDPYETVPPVTPTPEEPEEEELAKVLEVLPRNEAGLGNVNKVVSLDAVVKARVDCSIDPATVTASTFNVVDADGTSVSCNYELSSNDKVVSCRHQADFLTLTTYTATLSGVRCLEGNLVTETSWSWFTLTLGGLL